MIPHTRIEQLLTVPEIATYLHVPASWVYGKVAAEQMPHVRVGRYVRFSLSDVQAWLESEQVAA
jgi:excisionase family DNA binding protein